MYLFIKSKGYYFLYTVSIFIIFLTYSTRVLTETIWLEEPTLDFEIYDIVLDDKLMIFESTDVYVFNKPDNSSLTLLPFNAVISALEININYNHSSQQFKGRLNEKDVSLSLITSEKQNNPDVFVIMVEDEIFIDTNTLAKLIDANIETKSTELSILFTPNSELFPIQKRIERNNRNRIGQRSSTQDNYDFIVNDQYRLFTPFSGNVSAGLAVDNINNNDNIIENKYNINVNTYNDLFYHSANLSLSQQKDNKLTKRLTLSRSKNNPTDNIITNITHYSLGDVSDSNNRANKSLGGVGAVVTSHETPYNSYFGLVTIEEFATANWEAELYLNGYLIETGQVDAEGRIVFPNIKTRYGTNRFEIKTYGPFGEENIIKRNVLVGNNQLKVNQLKYSAGLIDTNHSLLNTNNLFDGVDLAPSAFLQTEYGLSTETSLGLGVFLAKDLETNKSTQEMVLSAVQQLPNALLETSLAINNDNEYNFKNALIGKIDSNSYYTINLNYLENENENENENYFNRIELNGSYNNIFKGMAYNLNASSIIDKNKFNDVSISTAKSRFSIRTVWRYKRFNLGNTLNYARFGSETSEKESTNDVKNTLSDNLSISTPLTKNIYFRLSASINLNDAIPEGTNRLTSLNTSLNWNVSKQFKNTTSINYRTNTDIAQVNNAFTWQAKNYNLYFNSFYNTNDAWQLSLGISFGLDYDHHKNSLNITNAYSSSTGTLDLFTFIDNNQNTVYDEYDEVLEGVKFGSASQWQDLTTLKNGMVYLPGVSPGGAVKINYDTNQTRAPNLQPLQDDFAFYTHPGGIVSLDIPFNYSTEIEGFVDFSSSISAKFIPIELLDNQGNLIKKVISYNDGVYVFPKIWPGKYQLRIDPQYIKTKSLKSVPELLTFTVTGSDDLIYMSDFILSSEKDEPSNTIINNDNDVGPYTAGVFSPITKPKPLVLPQMAINSPVINNVPLINKIPVINSAPKEKTAETQIIVTPYSQDMGNTYYRLQLGAYASNDICTEQVKNFSKLTTELVYKLQVKKMCKVFIGKQTNRQAVDQVLTNLPVSIRNKGAFIVNL